MDDYREQFKREYLAKLSEKKRKIATMTDKQKMEILDNAIDKGKIHLTDKAGFEYMAVLHHLEDYVDLLD